MNSATYLRRPSRTAAARRVAGAVSLAVAATLLAACGGDGADAAQDHPAGGSAESTAAAQAAAQRIAPFTKDAGEINTDVPLAGPPTEGRSVFFLVLNLPTTQIAQEGMQAAADAVGWDLKTLLMDPTDAQAFASGIEQAVAAGADYIVAAALDASVASGAVDKAKAAGIPILVTFGTDPAEGAENGIHASAASLEWTTTQFAAGADWIISDSGGEANLLFLTIPDIPILKTTDEAVGGQLEAECPTCAYVPLELAPADLGSGTIPSQVVSAIQANPEIDYVYAGFTDMTTGVPEALEQAGLADKVKVTTAAATPDDLRRFEDGSMVMATLNAQYYAYWLLMDAMLRIDQGDEIDPADYSMLPVAVADPTNVPSDFPNDTEWLGPVGFEDKYKELWQVG